MLLDRAAAGRRRCGWPQWRVTAASPVLRRLRLHSHRAVLLTALMLALPSLAAGRAFAGGMGERIAAGPLTGPQMPATASLDGPPVRVLLAEAPRFDLMAGDFGLRLRDGKGQILRDLGPGESLQLRVAAGGIAVAGGAAGPTSGPSALATELWLEPLGSVSQAFSFSLGADRYRGRLQVRLLESGQLQAVNHLPLETYLTSVVGSEMPASWPQAALQAQAVAARTYALSALKPAAVSDLKATVASQAYRGVASETDSTRQAVSATRGQVLMQDGRLIQAVFHSSSGGATEDSGQVWSRQLPYLVSVPDFDTGSPVSRWQMRLEPQQLRQQFRETDGVVRIDVLDTSQSGRVKRARVIGPGGSLELSGAELRQRLGLRSTLVTFQLQPTGGSLTPAAPAGVIDRAVSQALVSRLAAANPPIGAASVVVDSATGQVMTPAPLVAGHAPLTPPPSLDPGSQPAAPILPAYALVIDGRGFGHGVGMSQWGAFAMARQGRSYDQILHHYYRGVALVSYPGP